MRWWQGGLLGAVTLCAVMGVKALFVVPMAWFRGTLPSFDVPGIAGFVAGAFAMGFACGVVGWAGRGLHRKIGLLGDSLTGLAVGLVFALCIIIMFDPEDRVSVVCLMVVLGACLGPWFARDLRKELGEVSDQTNRHAD